MSKRHNTSAPNSPQPLPNTIGPAQATTSPRLPWPEFLRLWAVEVDTRCGGAPGHFLGNWLLGLALQAEALGAVSPDDHQVKAQIVADREAAWLAALEAEAMQPGVWGLTGDPDDPEATGALDGHPDSDEGAQRAWIALNPDDETFCN